MSETVSDAWADGDIRDEITSRIDLNDNPGPQTVVDDVADRLGIETDVVQKQLDLLEKHGFVYIAPADSSSEQVVKLPGNA
jgi:predicted ArsR family transcriptional regulator